MDMFDDTVPRKSVFDFEPVRASFVVQCLSRKISFHLLSSFRRGVMFKPHALGAMFWVSTCSNAEMN